MNPPTQSDILNLIAQTDRLNCSCEPIELEIDPNLTDAPSSLTLLGKIISDKPLNRNGIKNTLLKAWNPSGGLKIQEQDNRLLFSFNNEHEFQRVLDQRPWMTKNNVITIGKRIGDLVQIEMSKNGRIGEKGFMRLRVEVDVELPLAKGFALKRYGNEDAWIQFRYEHLSDFCYRCGHLGHVRKWCNHPRDPTEN
ncbi:hypothetical protein RJ639_009557 [Escallonia herrerae]|uniref:CCHC-type domain-containing protein n=1 Tax=Escallonia herrerae TaxID=1293975 RepID=A0AA88VV88_9ASTE|nr:hypothetical protein RJ639_009557 [Escallonia herrerae]